MDELVKLQKREYWIAGPTTLAASRWILTHKWKVTKCVHLNCHNRLIFFILVKYVIANNFYEFPVTFSRCYKDAYANSFFPCTFRLCRTASTVHKHLSSLGYFRSVFPCTFLLYLPLFVVAPYPCGVLFNLVWSELD